MTPSLSHVRCCWKAPSHPLSIEIVHEIFLLSTPCLILKEQKTSGKKANLRDRAGEWTRFEMAVTRWTGLILNRRESRIAENFGIPPTPVT